MRKSEPKPIRVIPNDGRHKTERRVFSREITTTFCVHPRCKFNGKPAVQGICFRDEEEVADWKKIEKRENEILKELKHFRRKLKGKKYADWLEAMYTTSWMNWSFVLDEVIRLRRDNALLKESAAQQKRRQKRQREAARLKQARAFRTRDIRDN